MRHLKARQRNDTGLWHYTTAKGDNAYPVGYCSLWTDCKECHAGFTDNGTMCEPCGGTGATKKKNPCEGHVTAEEACDHYKKYLIDKATYTEEVTDAKRVVLAECNAPGCTIMTSGGARVDQRFIELCAYHRERAILDLLVTVGESWES